jgi:hypothetical protein
VGSGNSEATDRHCRTQRYGCTTDALNGNYSYGYYSEQKREEQHPLLPNIRVLECDEDGTSEDEGRSERAALAFA